MELRLNNLTNTICNFFSKGSIRTLKAKRHVFLSFAYRGIDVALGILLVPIILNYFDTERYGIWLIIFSLTAWFNFMDIGLEQGLRNKLAELLSIGEKEKAKYYVSTCYAAIGIVSFSFLALFLMVNPFLDWTKLLNTSVGLKEELSILVIFVFGSFSITFILKIITTILIADQRPSVISLKDLLEKILKFVFVLLVICTTHSSLLMLGVVYSLAPIVILMIFSMYYFTTDYKNFRPSFEHVKLAYLKDLMNIGIKFFIINIAVVILFATDNIIITQLFGPKHVTSYEIAKKYFGIPLMIFMIIVQPLWSAVTEAYQKKDFQWIENIVNKLIKIWMIFSFFTVGMLLFSGIIYKAWVGEKVYIQFQLSAFWAIFVILQTYNLIFTYFINGTGILKVQLIGAIFSIIVNIPLSILFAKYFDLGISGVILATNISILIYGISRFVQYKKIITNTAHGIWLQ